MGITRGSEWRKWDLHVHTPKTLCSDYGGDTDTVWERYFNDLERLAKDKNIKVFGINDYLFIDGYKKVLEYKNSGGLKSVDLILPVIEFRLKEFVGSRELGRLNYHILFADESVLKVDLIESHFLSGLRAKANLDATTPDYQSWGGVITRDSLIDLGKHIIDNTPEDKRGAMSPLDVGFNNLNFELTKIEDLLGEGAEPNTFLKGKYFKAIGKAEWEDFRWDSSPLEKKTVANRAHFIFSASPSVEKANKGKESLKAQGVNDRLLHCSDSHGFPVNENNTKPKELGHCFTWIKAEPTFEGLKQIIYEPSERIRIQIAEPESEKLDNLMIEEVSFQSANNKFTPEIIRFNKNLNVIIGGKSSGKSILLYKIAKTLNAEVLLNNADEDLLKNNILKYKDTEDNKYKDLYDLSEEDASFNFKVKLFSGSERLIVDRPNQSSILPSIKYIPQNHLSNLVDKSRRSGNTLKKLIRDLILEEPDFKKKYNDFVDNAIRNDRQREQDVDYYFSLKEDIKKKEEELLTRGATKALEEGIDSNKDKLKQLSASFTPEESQEYNSLNERMNLLKIEESKINSDFDKIKNFNDEVKRFLNEFVNRKRILSDSLEVNVIKTTFLPNYNFIEDALSNVNDIENQIKKNEEGKFIQENIFKINLSKIKQEQIDVENKLKPFIEKFANQKQIESIQKSISEDQKKLSEIQQFRKEIDDSLANLKVQKQKIFDEFEKNFKLYTKILEELEPRISSIKNEDDKIVIIGSIKYNFPKFREMIESIINQKKFNNEDCKYLYQYEKDNNVKSALSEIDFNSIKSDLKNLFEKIENNPSILKGNNTERDACKKVLTDYFFDHWDVKSDNDDIHKMSTGKASFVLLKLIIKLSKDDGPILIDQPEDNLDNRSVSKELVEYLKLRKRERQIILVTHNPNIVVNADAENVIVANQNGQNGADSKSPYKFDYTNGALEDSFSNEDCEDLLKSMGIRQHIAEIVEGGMEAFKKREEKYGF
ncbi:hypothetical protein RAH57_18650 [Chryseobacterium sp. CKR4-1]|uniref:TrlF family AAA-like ATPase n=1 Tax=Chryseobacterium sp. CKR4-1 TaxID=3068896 RepID=UPI002796880C|nr:hypothetical protein [Chryseobacterium sp. CKR4-1]MDQ1806010.1 hypothetical protein [Chryseobacterium sp. CKR4-1]